MDIQKMNQQQHMINAYLLSPSNVPADIMINVSQYILTAAHFPRSMVRDDENAAEYDAQVVARGRLIQLWLDCGYDEDKESFEVPAGELQDHLLHYYGFCEDLALRPYYPK